MSNQPSSLYSRVTAHDVISLHESRGGPHSSAAAYWNPPPRFKAEKAAPFSLPISWVHDIGTRHKPLVLKSFFGPSTAS